MFKRIFTVGALFACLLLIGCKDPYGASAKAGADITSGIAQGMNTVAGLETQGQISGAEAANILGYLEFANKQDEAFLTCVAAAHAAGGVKGSYTACVTAFAATINSPSELALIHVNNPDAQANVEAVVNGITSAVAAINAALGGA